MNRVQIVPRGTKQIGFLLNGQPVTQAELKAQTASTPGLYGQIMKKASAFKVQTPRGLGVKSAGIKKAAAGTSAWTGQRAPKGNGANANNEGNVGLDARPKRGAHRFKKKFPPGSTGGGVTFMTHRPETPYELALYSFMGAFTPSVWQAWAGSELETRGVEAAVLARQATNASYQSYKFNRSIVNDPMEIFGHAAGKRTFIFKPRFSLQELKDDAEALARAGNKFGIAMKSLLQECANDAKSKGVDHVEPDIIEYDRVNNVLRIYECKIGKGKSETFPGESFQLLKGKRMMELLWNRMTNAQKNGREMPKIECYFLAWHFSIVKREGTPVFTCSSIDFKHHSTWKKGQNAIGERISSGLNTAYAGWDRVDPIVPAEFSRTTGLNSEIITAQLESQRASTLHDLILLSKTYERRYAMHTRSPTVRAALRVVHERARFVSGGQPTLFVPVGNIGVLRTGRWANYIKNWKRNNRSQPQINAEVREFGRKWIRAFSILGRSGIISGISSIAGISTTPPPPEESASNIEREINRRAGRITAGPQGDATRVEYLRRFFALWMRPDAFSESARAIAGTRRWSAVPGSITQKVADAVLAAEPNLPAEQRGWLQVMVGARTNRPEQALLTLMGQMSPEQQRQAADLAAQMGASQTNAEAFAYLNNSQ
jgi:hypothetical protein